MNKVEIKYENKSKKGFLIDFCKKELKICKFFKYKVT